MISGGIKMDQITGLKRGEKDRNDVLSFGNKTLSENSLKTYRKAVEEYLSYVKQSKQVIPRKCKGVVRAPERGPRTGHV